MAAAALTAPKQYFKGVVKQVMDGGAVVIRGTPQFLTKSKQDQALPSYVSREIWSHSTQYWLGFFLAVIFWETL